MVALEDLEIMVEIVVALEDLEVVQEVVVVDLAHQVKEMQVDQELLEEIKEQVVVEAQLELVEAQVGIEEAQVEMELHGMELLTQVVAEVEEKLHCHQEQVKEMQVVEQKEVQVAVHHLLDQQEIMEL
jgi:hypothetical protein